MLFDKTCRLGSVGDGAGEGSQARNGRVMNLASNDVERVALSANFLPFLVWGPLEAVAVLVVGICVLGGAFASGYAILLVFVPAQFYLSKRFAVLRGRVSLTRCFLRELSVFADRRADG